MLRKSLSIIMSIAALSTATADQSRFPGPLGSDPWEHRPNDPNYEDMWQLFSHIPVDQRGLVNERERALGAGMHVDRAWQLHTGTPSMVIAVLDSGIHWDAHDLVDRHFLNVGELPLPNGSGSYDANGDGRVSVSDYANDPRVYDANKNGLIDAGDLIQIFSDQVDDDGNGYVDDIAGWDFFEHDNDPGDRTKFGHGTGEAKDSVAAMNNGIGGAGICGNCSFMALRLDDSFVVDANPFAQAVIYATDLDVGLIQQALGSVNHSRLTQEAVNYAYDRDVVIIGSAADENSFHHNYPSTLDPVVYTNAIRYDTRDFRDASTFLNFNNCSNYGPRVDVATSGRSCSSEATGNLSGIAGLARSYARSLGHDLSAGELISLIKTTATDINLGPATADSGRHPTHEGWDSITGYGRTHAYDLLNAIKERKIPPEARILSPGWFEFKTYDQNASGQIEIKAQAEGAVRLTFTAMRGIETALPRGEKAILKRDVLKSLRRGEPVSVSFDYLELTSLPVPPGEEERNHDAFTFILTATNRDGISAEARRTVFLHRDERSMPAFPRRLAGSGESSGLFVDLNNDGRDEFVTGDGAGFLHAFRADGSEAPGFPVAVPASSRQGKTGGHYASIFAPIAAGDIDGDGSPDIVAVTLEGHIVAIAADGSMKPGFPVRTATPNWSTVDKSQPLAQGIMAAPVLADLTGDGKDDIIVAAMDGRIYSFTQGGATTPGYPVTLEAEGKLARLMSSPAVYDINSDGVPDLILGSNHVGDATGYLFAVNGQGSRASHAIISGFPIRVPLIKDAVLPTVGTGIPTAPAIADFNGDGTPEILVHAFVGKPYLVSLAGALQQSMSIKVSARHETNDEFMLAAFGHPAAIDVDGDGVLQPVSVGVGQRMLVSLLLGGKRLDYHHMIGAWGRDGNMLPGFPKAHDDMILAGGPIAVDINNDGRSEIAVGSGGYYLRIKGEAAGSVPVSDAYFTGGWIFGAPSTGDMDGDGLLEIAVTTREGYVFVWKTNAQKSQTPQWSTFKGNNRRTGVLHTPSATGGRQ